MKTIDVLLQSHGLPDIAVLEAKPDDEIDAITHRNALRLYRFDGLAKAGGREKCTVGSLRELGAGVDTREVSLGGIAPRGHGAGRVVTSADILGTMGAAMRKPG